MEQPDKRVVDDGADASWPARLDVRPGLLEFLVAVSLISFALWIWFGSYSFEESGRGLMGAAAFPRGVALLLGGASLIMAYRGVRALMQRDEKEATESVTFQRPVAVLVAAILIVLYPLLLPYFGFYPTTGVWFLTLLWVVGQRSVIWALISTLGFLLAVKLAFQMAMGIPLP